jgi:hypothetical protein
MEHPQGTATYYARKTAGLCTKCGLVPPHQDQLRCDNCRGLVRERSADGEARAFSVYYVTTRGRAAHMLNSAHQRAKQLDVTCSITRDWIEKKLDAGVCEVTGLPFDLSVGSGRGRHKENAFSPSLDRKIQTGGYTPENVRVTCWIYNRARGAFPDADLDRMLRALAKNYT